MVIGVEVVPQSLPAECTFSGHASHSCDKFLRIQLPEHYFFDNILISDHFFKQMAEEMGYVAKSKQDELLKAIKEDANGMAPGIDVLLNRIDVLRSELDALQSFEKRLSELRESIDSLNGLAKEPMRITKSSTSK